MSTPDRNNGAKITVHWLDRSRSQRILFLLEHLQLKYALKTYKRGNDKLAPPELKEVHPLGKSPVVTVEHENLKEPLVLAESGLICEWLGDHFGTQDGEFKAVPRKWKDGMESQLAGETEEYHRYKYFLHYAEGSLMALLVIGLVIMQIRDAPVPFFLKPITRSVASNVNNAFLDRNYRTHFSFIESQLESAPSGGPFLCGEDFTTVDALMVFPLEAATGRAPLSKEQYPRIIAYVERLQAMDAYKRAIERVKEETGSYEASL